MPDPVVVKNESVSGGWTAAFLVAALALVVVLFFAGVIDFGEDRKVEGKVGTPAVEVPAEPTVPSQGDAPAKSGG